MRRLEPIAYSFPNPVAADYFAGVSGTAFCDACEQEFDWGM
jgi:hypothetical protein